MHYPPPRVTAHARPSDHELHGRQGRVLESAQRAGFDGLIVWAAAARMQTAAPI